jgi:hypothetical protein
MRAHLIPLANTFCLNFTSLTVYCFAIRAARVCVSGLLLFTKMASKKRKIDSECRLFKVEWSWKYFFTVLKDKPLCLHFTSKHDNASYAAMTEAERKQNAEEVRKKFSGIQNIKKNRIVLRKQLHMQATLWHITLLNATKSSLMGSL